MNVPRVANRLLKRAPSPCIFCTARHFSGKARKKPVLRKAASRAVGNDGTNPQFPTGSRPIGEILRSADFQAAQKYGFLKTSPATAEAILLELAGEKEIDGKLIKELATSEQCFLLAPE